MSYQVMSDFDEEENEYIYSDEDESYECDDDGDSMSEGYSGASGISSAPAAPAAPVMHHVVSTTVNPNSPDSSSLSHFPQGISRLESVDGRRMMASEDLRPEMNDKISAVAELLNIPTVAAAALLRECKWVVERLNDSYLSDSEAMLERVGMTARCSGNVIKNDIGTCSICMEDDKPVYSMPCYHSFCRDCWGQYLEITLKDGPSCLYKTCPQPNCNEKVTEEEIKALAPHLLPKYSFYQLKSFVELNPCARWCPGTDCDKVGITTTGWGCLSCDCGTSFCLRCGEEPHSPASCADIVRWNEKCQNESETANWILANTKPCPKCSSRIEKNQGCNHMVCQQCKYEFCWICCAPWLPLHGANTGGYYKCNRFEDGGEGDDQSDKAKAQRELNRYLHYYKRFHAHSEAEKFARKQLQETEKRMILLQESTANSTWIDVQFLKTAVEQLIECRKVLKYTYTYAYYLPNVARIKDRFEYHQEMLEKFTENLSELSEQPLADMNRTEVINVTRVVSRFMKNILKYVDEGMEDDA